MLKDRDPLFHIYVPLPHGQTPHRSRIRCSLNFSPVYWVLPSYARHLGALTVRERGAKSDCC